MRKYCIYPQWAGFLPMLNPKEIKDHLKMVDVLTLSEVMAIVDSNGKFLEWYEEIYSGIRDREKGEPMALAWREKVLSLNQKYLEWDGPQLGKERLAVELLCLGWIAGEDTYLIAI